MKSKGAKERYKHLNAEFQRIARRDNKAFLSDQWIDRHNLGGNTQVRTNKNFLTLSAEKPRNKNSPLAMNTFRPVLLFLKSYLLIKTKPYSLDK